MIDILERMRGVPDYGDHISKILIDAAAEIERLRTDRKELLTALDLVMTGGNHLASLLVNHLGPDFCHRYPPTVDPTLVLHSLTLDEYEVWCCWSAIMRARAAIAKDRGHKP